MKTLGTPDSKATEIVDLEVSPPQETFVPAKSYFTVGDFVWAKAKGQPWWPALVSASSGSGGDSQKTQRNRHSVLVAYFGDDETAVWCEPKQLKPFFQVFDEMAAQSSSKSFLGALGNAIGEVGLCLEMEMSCHCVPVEAMRNPLRRNSGKKLPISNYLPEDFLRFLRNAAMDVHVVKLLDAVRLRTWAIAFEKGFLQGESWVFNRRHGIEDLVDKIDLDAPDPELVNGMEEEEAPAENPRQERKRRSMTKLIAETDLDAVELDDDDEEEEEEKEKGLGSSKSKKKINFELLKVEEESVSVTGRRARKKSKYLSPPYTNLGEESKGLGLIQKSLEEKSSKRAARSPHSVDGSSAILRCSSGEDESQSPWVKIGQTSIHDIYSEFVSTAENPIHLKWNRGAKIVRWFFSLYRTSIYSDGAEFEDYRKLVNEYIAENVEGTDQEGKLDLKSAMDFKQNNDRSEKQKTGKKKIMEGGTDSEIYQSNASEDSERKPKTLRKTLIEPVHSVIPMEFSSNEGIKKQTPKRKKKMSMDVTCSKDETPLEDSERKQKTLRKTLIESVHSVIPMEFDSNEGIKKQTPQRKKKMSKDETSSNAPVPLNKIDASDEGKLGQGKKKRKNASKVEEAMDLNLQMPSVIRERFSKVVIHAESINHHEPKSFDFTKIEMKDDVNGKSLLNLGDGIVRNPEEAKLVCRKKNGDGLQKAKSGSKKNKIVGNSCGGQTALQLNFHSGIALPSIEDLIITYSKYGALVESKIKLLKKSNSARVVFAKTADAENAFNDKAGPYGSIATYHLHNFPKKLITPKPIHELISHSPDSKVSTPKPPLPFIRRSLETMISTLCWPSSSSSSVISNPGVPSEELKPEARDNLVGEMQGLLQKVDKMLNGGEKSSNSFT